MLPVNVIVVTVAVLYQCQIKLLFLFLRLTLPLSSYLKLYFVLFVCGTNCFVCSWATEPQLSVVLLMCCYCLSLCHITCFVLFCSVHINSFSFCFFLFSDVKIIVKWKEDSNVMTCKIVQNWCFQQISCLPILLSCLGEGFKSYFLWDICFITLVHHSQSFK